jgi:hypothetical protein
MLEGLPSTTRAILYRTIWPDINTIPETDMASILFAIYKDVYVIEHKFYEPTHEKQFWIHKMNEDNIEFDALVCALLYA